jgi:CheY-like chemotaxis protein
MNRILLADDSPHAQRMGERILRDEGYEVVSVTDGETALLRLADVDPDVILADAFLPGRSGLDICRFIKSHPGHAHMRIVLTAGMLKTFDEAEARAAGASAIVKKPFEASAVLEVIKPLMAEAQSARATVVEAVSSPNPLAPNPESAAIAPSSGTGVSEEELLRAAVTVALDSAFPSLVDDITAKILNNLRGAITPLPTARPN